MAKPSIGIIGAGRLGTAIARQASEADYEVRIANSKEPESLDLILSVLLPKVTAAPIPELIKDSDVVILAIPLNQYKTLPPDSFTGKILIDAMNYWPPTEGAIPEFNNPNSSSSEYIQSYFSGAIVVKTLNHVAYNELNEHNLPSGTPNRRAIALAGNNPNAMRVVSDFIDTLGFDPIDAGDLHAGHAFQPDTALFNARLNAAEMRDLLAASS